jgi:hypothetical protein
MHSDWFNEIEILQGKWQHGEKVGYCYHSGLEKTLCKWEMYFPLVTKWLNPETNSDPPAAKSKGARLFSVQQETNQIKPKN